MIITFTRESNPSVFCGAKTIYLYKVRRVRRLKLNARSFSSPVWFYGRLVLLPIA